MAFLGLGKTLASRTLSGDQIVWVYAIRIGSKGNRAVTVTALDSSSAETQVKRSFNIIIGK